MSMQKRIDNHKNCIEMLEVLVDQFDIPEANCSCHINPPCADCVNYSWLREQIFEANRLIGEAKQLGPIAYVELPDEASGD